MEVVMSTQVPKYLIDHLQVVCWPYVMENTLPLEKQGCSGS